MRDVARDRPDSRVMVIESPGRKRGASSKFVRLSQLHKLRGCEQVAAVCYRMRRGSIEFLLVRTRGSGRWTFPKGSAEPGLTHAQAAALEAFEEAGVHGRIEESPFVRYVRRRQVNRGNPALRSDEGVAVNAFLCEVLRLSSPQESNRNRTWFSVEDARRSLREGRKSKDGAEFVRVIGRAVARIQQQRGGADVVDRTEKARPRPAQPQRFAAQKDALQKVPFDFAEAYGWLGEASSMAFVRRQLAGTRQAMMPVVDVNCREGLPCEVLEFSSSREKKARALGTGIKNG